MPAPELQHDPSARRYRLRVNAEEIGFIEYDPIAQDAILVKHTEVAPAHEGHGYASTLVRFMLEDIRRQGKQVIPICPYTAAFIQRHREYMDVVREDYRRVLG